MTALLGSAGGPYFLLETWFVYELAIDYSKGPPGRALGSPRQFIEHEPTGSGS